VQIIEAKVVGDMTLASAISSELKEYGWTAGTGNIPAAYLTGLLAGLRAKARGIGSPVLDIGLNPPTKGSKVYASLKGIIDAGVDIPYNEEVLPDESRISGEHIVDAYKHFSEGETAMFTSLGKKKTTITGIPKKFAAVKKALLEIPKADLKKKKKKTAAKPAPKPTRAKKEREKPAQKPPRAVPRKPKPKKLIARGKGKKGKRRR
jgi:large subunit ribosomal protein L18